MSGIDIQPLLDKYTCMQSNLFGLSSIEDYICDRSPLPPPRPPLNLQQDRELATASSFIRRTRIRHGFKKLEEYRKWKLRERRKCQIARQFHGYVILLRHFEKWENQTKLKRIFISSHRLVLRRILYKWRVYAEEARQRRKAARDIFRLISGYQLQLLHQCINKWEFRCYAMRLIKKIFLSWKERTNLNACKMYHLQRLIMTNAKRSNFKKWYNNSKLICYQRTKYSRIAKIILFKWKCITDDRVITLKLKTRQAQSRDEDRSFKILSQTFAVLKTYTCIRRYQRTAYMNLLRRYRDRLQNKALKQWILFRDLTRKVHAVIFRSIKRRTFMDWRLLAQTMRQNELRSTHIIFNRWNILAATTTERRNLNLRIFNYWADRKCKEVLKGWLTVVQNQMFIATPPLRTNLRLRDRSYKAKENFGARHATYMTSVSPEKLNSSLMNHTKHNDYLNSTHNSDSEYHRSTIRRNISTRSAPTRFVQMHQSGTTSKTRKTNAEVRFGSRISEKKLTELDLELSTNCLRAQRPAWVSNALSKRENAKGVAKVNRKPGKKGSLEYSTISIAESKCSDSVLLMSTGGNTICHKHYRYAD